MNVIAIDPGNTESAFAVVDTLDCRPIRIGKADNHLLRLEIVAGNFHDCDGAAIEMIASYGMPVGADVFETCVWIGRFLESIRLTRDSPPQPVLIYRRDIKLHHCHSSKAKDANITQALIDRFAPGQPNRGKGTKTTPGWFHGFHTDIWQSYALAVYLADTSESREGAA